MVIRELGRVATLKRIWIKNFKSPRNLELEMPSKLTVVAGYNGFGKTALVEVFELLTYILDWARRLNPNPFSKWWGYGNIVWRHDEDLPIVIGLELKLDNIEKKMHRIKSNIVKDLLSKYSSQVTTPLNITYEFAVSGKGGRFQVLSENLVITGKNVEIGIDTSRNLLSMAIDLANEFHSLAKTVSSSKEIYKWRFKSSIDCCSISFYFATLMGVGVVWGWWLLVIFTTIDGSSGVLMSLELGSGY